MPALQRKWQPTSEKKSADCTDVSNCTSICRTTLAIRRTRRAQHAHPVRLPIVQTLTIVVQMERKSLFSHSDRWALLEEIIIFCLHQIFIKLCIACRSVSFASECWRSESPKSERNTIRSSTSSCRNSTMLLSSLPTIRYKSDSSLQPHQAVSLFYNMR